MKNIIFIAAIGLFLLLSVGSSAQEAKVAGDANADGVVNILDLMLVASHLGKSTDPTRGLDLDVNVDGVANILDLVFVINVIRGGTSGAIPMGGTLIFGRGGDSLTLDSAAVTDGESAKVCDMLYDTLVQYKGASTDLEPGLAETWTSSPDGLTWTFHLRQDVQFHDGTPFNADAVVFSLNRRLALFPDTNELFDQIIALDPFTVQIQLTTPYAPFISVLAGTAFSIVSPTAVQSSGEDFGNNPVGTGPFSFVQWDRNDKIVLQANLQHWGGRPALDRLIFRSIPDNAVRLIELQNGNIHAMEFPNPDELPLIQGDPELDILMQPGLNVGYLAMNMDKYPFDNRKVRLALNHAINKTQIIEHLYQGLGIAAKNPIPPSLWGYNASIEDYVYDPELAKQLLAEAGYPDGFETTLWALPVPRPYIPDGMILAEAIRSDLLNVGIEAKIVTYDWGTYIEKSIAGEHDIVMIGWITDAADPDNILYSSFSKTSPYNFAFYRSDEMTDLLERARTITDQDVRELASRSAGRGGGNVGAKPLTARDVRTRLYQQAQVIFHRDAPWVPLAHAQRLLVINRRVKNLMLPPVGWKYLSTPWLEEE